MIPPAPAREILKPRALQPGDVIGVFTPSTPGYAFNPGLFDNGVRNLERLGFKVRLGSLTARRGRQGYRSGTPRERANELMELVRAPEVRGLLATIGGHNSSSLIPYLDFDAIREARQILCGYSDITSLHLAWLRYAGLRTFYGTGAQTWFGEWPDGIPEQTAAWLAAVQSHVTGPRELRAPARWSNHKRRWDNDDWKTIPREWQPNPGWKTLYPGDAEAPLLSLNLNLLVHAAGTPHFPDTRGKILFIEQMNVTLSNDERCLRHLQLLGVFDDLAGLVLSKPEVYDGEGAPFGYDDLLMEVVADRPGWPSRRYPIVSGFDAGHTLPMLTLPQLTPTRLQAAADGVKITLLDGALTPPTHFGRGPR